MPAAIQMNTRIDAQTKRRGDAVLSRCGYSPSQAVRCLWEYAVEHDDVPAFMKSTGQGEGDAEIERRLLRVEEGSGLGLRLIRDVQGGAPTGLSAQDLCDDTLLGECMLADMVDILEGGNHAGA